MGAGDWIMATGQVKKMFAHTNRPVAVLSAKGSPQWAEIFDNNPKIARYAGMDTPTLINGPNVRPYIVGRTDRNWTWRPFHPEPGEIFLSESERDFAARYAGMVMIEPTVKRNGHANKAWVPGRWQQLADRQVAPMIQCGPIGTQWLTGVRKVSTPTFRHACAVLAVSRAFVGPEGGLHHAAAAFGIPAVVLWSHFIDVPITGYAAQRNIRHVEGWCGSRVPCETCAASMRAISVDEVVETLRELLQ